MPRVQERTRGHLLPPPGVALIAWQRSESLSKTGRRTIGSWGAIRTVFDDDVSLCEVAGAAAGWMVPLGSPAVSAFPERVGTSSMVELVMAAVALASACIFLAHVIEAYRA